MQVEHEPISSIHTILIVTGILVALVAAGIAIWWTLTRTPTPVQPPQQIISQIDFLLYAPTKLPGNYRIEDDSFTLAEGAVIFKATDGAGGTITFSEQQKPANFNFEEFYSKQLSNPETLSSTPYPSVFGTSTANGSKIISIVTDHTWIIANTQSPLSKDNLETIAATIKELR